MHARAFNVKMALIRLQNGVGKASNRRETINTCKENGLSDKEVQKVTATGEQSANKRENAAQRKENIRVHSLWYGVCMNEV